MTKKYSNSQGFAAPAEDGSVAANATTMSDVALAPVANATAVAAETLIPAANTTAAAAPAEAVTPAANGTDTGANNSTVALEPNSQQRIIRVGIVGFTPRSGEEEDADASEDKAQEQEEDNKPCGGFSGVLRTLAEFLSKIRARVLGRNSADQKAAEESAASNATETKSDVGADQAATQRFLDAFDEDSEIKIVSSSAEATSPEEAPAAEAAWGHSGQARKTQAEISFHLKFIVAKWIVTRSSFMLLN